MTALPSPEEARLSLIGQQYPTTAKSLRLLVPVASFKGALAGIHYAVRRRTADQEVDVCLLHVEEPIDQWEILRTANVQDAQRRQKVEGTLTQVSRCLVAEGIPFAAFVRSGSTVFTILDAAEQLDCDEIAVPRPRGGWRRIFSRDIVATLLTRQRGIPIVVVDSDGVPADEGGGGAGKRRA